jgi:hypothetical protein
MADEKMIAHAKEVYNNFCNTLDKREWSYKTNAEDMTIFFSVSGDDIPMDFLVRVDAETQLLRVTSPLPFTVPENKRIDMAVATCDATSSLLDGSFDFDLTEGKIYFRLTASFRETDVGEGLFEYLVGYSGFAVDEYNDKLLAISKGIMSIEDFLSKKD